MKVICISGKAQHGKDTSAQVMKDYLENKGQRVLVTHCADLLKYICKAFFYWDGEKDDNGRSLLQYVGTDVIRKQNPEFWVNFIAQIISMFDDSWDFVIICDCRFPNEIDTLKRWKFDTYSVRINRKNFDSPLSEEQQRHRSETALDDYSFHRYINNDSDLPTLRSRVEYFLEGKFPI